MLRINIQKMNMGMLMLGMLGSFDRCKYMNVRKGQECQEILIGAKYMKVCIIKFMYDCRCSVERLRMLGLLEIFDRNIFYY